jgi:hypothetical protein
MGRRPGGVARRHHTMAGREATPSPDGSRLLNLSGNPFPLLLRSRARDGSDERVLHDGQPPATNAAWSPDGMRIAYYAFADTTDLVNVRNGQRQRVGTIVTTGVRRGSELTIRSTDGSRTSVVHLDARTSVPRYLSTRGPSDSAEMVFDSGRVRGWFAGPGQPLRRSSCVELGAVLRPVTASQQRSKRIGRRESTNRCGPHTCYSGPLRRTTLRRS